MDRIVCTICNAVVGISFLPTTAHGVICRQCVMIAHEEAAVMEDRYDPEEKGWTVSRVTWASRFFNGILQSF